MRVLDARLYKNVEWRLYNYHALRRQAQESDKMREDILHAGRVSIEPGGRGNSRRADPTARKAAELAALDNRAADARLWVQVIEYVIARYEGTPKGRLLEMQYFEELGTEHICNKLLIGRPTYFAWRKELVLCTALAAAELRLIQVCKKNMQKV